jgi:hypothetical protein
MRKVVIVTVEYPAKHYFGGDLEDRIHKVAGFGTGSGMGFGVRDMDFQFTRARAAKVVPRLRRLMRTVKGSKVNQITI